MKVAEALSDFVSYIGEKIDILCIPQKEIIEGYKNETLEKTGILTALSNNNSIETTLIQLPEELRIKACDFFKKLGSGDKCSQVALCKNMSSELERELSKMKDKLSDRVRVYRCVPLLCALSAVVLII